MIIRRQYIWGHQGDPMKVQPYISCKYRSPSRSATEAEKGPQTLSIIPLCRCNPVQEPNWNVILPRIAAMVCKLWRIHYFLACEVLDGGLLAFRASQVQHHVSGLIGPPVAGAYILITLPSTRQCCTEYADEFVQGGAAVAGSCDGTGDACTSGDCCVGTGDCGCGTSTNS